MSPIDCEGVLREIELYLDGEAGAAHAEIHQHLEICGPCLDHAEFRRRLKELLRCKCGCDDLPDSLERRIRSMFTEPSGPSA